MKQKISLPLHSFGVCDFETSPIKDGIQSFLCGGIYDYDYFRYYESIDEIVNYFVKAEHKIFYFHNLSYDYRFLLHYLLDNFDIKIIPRGSQILKIDVYRDNKLLFELRDSYAVFPLSLKKVSESFCSKYVKSNIDIMNIEHIFKTDKQKVIKYLKLDCLSLYESLSNFIDVMEINKPNITISCTALQKWKKFYPDHKDIRCFHSYDDTFRLGYYGARTEVFNMKCNDGYYYDVNSLYPYVMLVNDFPIGKIRKLKNDMQYFFAYITVEIPECYIPPLPYRHNFKIYFPVGKWEGWYNSVDIKLCQSLGFKVKIHKGFGWENSDNIFYDYIQKYYGIKKESQIRNQKALYEISKLMMNSLYGKFGEKKDRENITTIDKFDNLKKIVKKNKVYTIDKKYKLFSVNEGRKEDFTTTYISCFITSLARKHLFDILISIVPDNKIYYCDTDSIITDKLLPTSDNIGDLKLESEVYGGYFALPKMYSFRNKKKESIIRCKGLDYNKIRHKDIMDFVESHKTIENKSTRISTLKKILKNEIDFTECYELKRKVEYKPAIFKRKIVNNYDTIPYNIDELNKKG